MSSTERTTYIPPEAMGLTEEQERDKAAMGEKEGQWEHFTPEFVGTKAQTLSFDDALKGIELEVRGFQEARISQPEGWVQMKTDLPIAVVFMGDLHWGSIYTNHAEILRKFEIIKKTPNAYILFMANLIDNAIPTQFPDNMLTNAIPPDKQVIMMRRMIKELDDAGRVLGAVVSPCHEGWTFKKTGQDINALLYGYEGRHFPVLENGGRIYLQMPGVLYRGAIYHQVGPFDSNFNETHPVKQLNRLKLRMQADFVAGAHKHVAATETVYEGTGNDRRIVAYARTGSEKGTGKIHDAFSTGKYGDTGEPTGQIVHLWPRERRLMANTDFDTGILAHECIYLRAMVKRDQAP